MRLTHHVGCCPITCSTNFARTDIPRKIHPTVHWSGTLLQSACMASGVPSSVYTPVNLMSKRLSSIDAFRRLFLPQRRPPLIHAGFETTWVRSWRVWLRWLPNYRPKTDLGGFRCNPVSLLDSAVRQHVYRNKALPADLLSFGVAWGRKGISGAPPPPAV